MPSEVLANSEEFYHRNEIL